MPELPEVETIKLGLEKKIPGQRIVKVITLNPGSFLGDEQAVEYKKVRAVWRKGKVLGIDLEGDITLLVHLKMTGQLILDQRSKIKNQKIRMVGGHPTKEINSTMPVKYTRVIFEFSDNSKLYFNDQRKFGWIKLADSEQVTGNSMIKNMGPEPLESEFTPQVFKNNLLKHPKLTVKAAILDQSTVAGVGNIYASEALFLAGVLPGRQVSSLSDSEIKSLWQGIRESLNKGIAHGGSTRSHYVNAEGGRGYFLDYANVYGREKSPCRVCRGLIKKTKISGRGTYYCENCQK